MAITHMATTSLTSMGNEADSLAVDSRATRVHTRAGVPFLREPHDGKGIHMHATIVRTAVPMLLVLTLGALSFAGEPPRPQASSAPSIEGTYTLISRQLPDGTRLSPPDIMGLWTYTKTHRNFNIVQKDTAGKFHSFSVVSTYTLTATDYTETLLFSLRTDQTGGKEPIYDLSGQTRSAPVTVAGGRIRFKAPFEPPSFVFEGTTLTATIEGRVDMWEKVE
jgi:hypothetical protein